MAELTPLSLSSLQQQQPTYSSWIIQFKNRSLKNAYFEKAFCLPLLNAKAILIRIFLEQIIAKSQTCQQMVLINDVILNKLFSKWYLSFTGIPSSTRIK
jgi:hypothetical protein